jgi:hypothetical protein
MTRSVVTMDEVDIPIFVGGHFSLRLRRSGRYMRLVKVNGVIISPVAVRLRVNSQRRCAHGALDGIKYYSTFGVSTSTNPKPGPNGLQLAQSVGRESRGCR